MPASSTEIADEFVKLASADRRSCDSMKLQKLVYIAHGLCLVTIRHPLALDRPQARASGPVFKELKDALAPFVFRPRDRGITPSCLEGEHAIQSRLSLLDAFDREIIAVTYQDWGMFSAQELSIVTCEENAAWAQIYAGGTGVGRTIPDHLILEQFAELTASPGAGDFSTVPRPTASVPAPQTRTCVAEGSSRAADRRGPGLCG